MSGNRARIDRRYLLGDTLIKTGAALFVFLGFLALIGPVALRLQGEEAAGYGLLLAVFALLAAGLAIYGRVIRKQAVRMDRG
jgi:uncharacterized membrane-anchored protein